MKTVILAAGQSKRIQPISDKNFLNFCGKPLIEWQLDNMSKAGLDDFIIVCGAHNIEQITAFANDYPKRAQIVEQKDLESGMKGAILAAKEAIGDEEFLMVSSNDVVDDEAFSVIIEAAKDQAFDSFLLAKVVHEYFPGGYMELGHEMRIEHIIEKPGAGNEPSNLVNIVVHLHRKPATLFKYLEQAKSEKDDLYEVALAQMIADDIPLKAVEYHNFWQAIKYPWHIFPVADYFFDRTPGNVSPEAEVAPTAIIKGNVIIEAGAKIYDGAIISGPAYIGKNSIVANNALVRGSYIGDNCVIGFSTEIARSFLGNEVWTHSNYIGDSIIGNNCSFGAGTVIGNLRLDEANIMVRCDEEKISTGTNKFGIIMGDNVRCGINTSFMPGIKIGANSMIGAGIVISEDIPAGQLVYGKWELKTKPSTATLDNSKRADMKGKLAK